LCLAFTSALLPELPSSRPEVYSQPTVATKRPLLVALFFSQHEFQMRNQSQ